MSSGAIVSAWLSLAAMTATEIDRSELSSTSADRDSGRYCLTFLDRFHGGTRQYLDVAALTGKLEEGLTLDDLETGARKLGYHTRRVKVSAANLPNLAETAIVSLDTPVGRGSRFAVFFGWDENVHGFQMFDPPHEVGPRNPATLANMLGSEALVVSPREIPPDAELWSGRGSASSGGWFWRAGVIAGLIVLGILLGKIRSG